MLFKFEKIIDFLYIFVMISLLYLFSDVGLVTASLLADEFQYMM
jgi:hypothetical protein